MTETVLVDCEKVVVKRLDGIYEITYAEVEFIKEGCSLEWQVDEDIGRAKVIQATHVSCLRNNHLLFEEFEVKNSRLF